MTSLSAAPLQIGSDCERQKLRLHWLQEGDEELPFARRASRVGVVVPSTSPPPSRVSCSLSSASLSSSSTGSGSGSAVPSDGGWCCEGGLDGEPPVEDLGLISMIVLLVKQVHLQNVGAAVYVDAGSVSWVRPKGGSQRPLWMDAWIHLHAATAREAKAPSRSMRTLSRFILLMVGQTTLRIYSLEGVEPNETGQMNT